MQFSFLDGVPLAQVLPLLRKTNLIIEMLVVIGYLLAVALKPAASAGMTPLDMLALGGMLGALCAAFVARTPSLWRSATILFFCIEALAFKLQIDSLESGGAIWSLALAIMVNYGITTLIPKLLDYLLIVTFFWVVLCYDQMHWLIAPDQMPLFQIVVLWCFGSGAFINHSFMRTLYGTLVLKESYRIQAETDVLTGIANRRALLDELQRVYDSPSGRGAFFVMLDIDDFKRINDDFGHDRGDEILTFMANSFAVCCPQGRYGRLGGEEFGIVFDGSTEQDVVDALQRLFQQTQRAEPAFSFSAGLARLDPALTPSEILKHADQQLYLAKRAGKGRLFLDSQTRYAA